MPNLKITEFGIIKGGNCEKIFKQRSDREKGASLAIEWLLNNNCISIQKGWCKITKVPKNLYSMWWVINNICKTYGGDAEIGWHRFIGDIALTLLENGKSFRLSNLKKRGAQLSSLEFALKGTIKHHKLAYTKPHLNEIYKKWKK